MRSMQDLPTVAAAGVPAGPRPVGFSCYLTTLILFACRPVAVTRSRIHHAESDEGYRQFLWSGRSIQDPEYLAKLTPGQFGSEMEVATTAVHMRCRDDPFQRRR